MEEQQAPDSCHAEDKVRVGDDAETELVRTGQKLVLYAILANTAVTALSTMQPVLGLIGLPLLGLFIYGVVRIGKGLGSAIWVRIVIAVCMVIPLLNLLVLLILNGRATKALKAAGFKVGLMGARPRVA